MNTDEKINKIKALLGFGVKLESMKLENGTMIEAEKFESGFEVFIVSEDNKTALPVGDYALEDGKILVVTEEGIIGEIKDAPADEPAEEPAETTAPVEAQSLSMEELSKTFVSLDAFTKAIEELKGLIKPVEVVKAEAVEEVKEEVELKTVHSPETETEKKEAVRFGNKTIQTPQDRIYGMINKK